jgi:4-hydroxy-tetrahydrodipicolinate synthase
MWNMIKGILPVLPVPFLDDGSVSTADFEGAIRFGLEARVHGVVFPGTASEAAFLTREERRDLTRRLVQRVDGAVPVVIGVSGASRDEVVANIALAAEADAAALMLIPSKALGADVAALTEAFGTLDTGGLPIILQNVPPPTGVELDSAAIGTLAEAVKSIRYVKEEGLPSGQLIQRTLAAAGASLAGVFGGGGARYIVDELMRGSCGAMPALELADVHVRLYEAFRADDMALTRALYDITMPLLMMQAVFRTGLTKQVLRLRGIIGSTHVRANFPPMDATDAEEASYWVGHLEARLAALAAEGAR